MIKMMRMESRSGDANSPFGDDRFKWLFSLAVSLLLASSATVWADTADLKALLKEESETVEVQTAKDVGEPSYVERERGFDVGAACHLNALPYSDLGCAKAVGDAGKLKSLALQARAVVEEFKVIERDMDRLYALSDEDKGQEDPKLCRKERLDEIRGLVSKLNQHNKQELIGELGGVIRCLETIAEERITVKHSTSSGFRKRADRTEKLVHMFQRLCFYEKTGLNDLVRSVEADMRRCDAQEAMRELDALGDW